MLKMVVSCIFSRARLLHSASISQKLVVEDEMAAIVNILLVPLAITEEDVIELERTKDG